MALYGDIAHVKKLLRPNETTAFGTDVDDRLSLIQKAVSARLEFEIGGSFGGTQSDSTMIVWGGASPILLLPVPARSITSVVTGITVSGNTASGGTTLPSSEYVYDPVDSEGRILGLRLNSNGNWGVTDNGGKALTPIKITADFTSTDFTTVPDDITYIANLLILRTFQLEMVGIEGVMGPEGGFTPPRDPWQDPLVRKTIERYRVRRVPML